MNSLNHTVRKLKNFASNYRKDKIRIIGKNKVFQQPHLFFYSMLVSETLDGPYADVFKESIVSCENDFPGSSLDLIESIFNENKIENDIIKSKPKFQDIDVYFKKEKVSKDILDLFYSLIKFSGPDVNIDLKYSKTFNQVTRKTNSFFKLNVEKDFYSILFNKNKYSKRKCSIVVIDGFIEKESSLVPALEFSKENNTALIIICRGMLDSAKSFIKQCMIKNNLTCLVYTKKFDDKDPFLFEDISLSFDCNLIKDHQTVVREINKNIKICENIILYPDKIGTSFSNQKIVAKIKELENIDNDYIKFRKKRLKNKSVEVFINNKETIEGLKYCLTAYNLMLKHGIYKTNKNNIIPIRKYMSINRHKLDLENKLKSIRYIHNVK